jgi:hypothetical protein
MFAAGLAQRQARSALVTILIRDGRPVDDSLAPVWAKVHDEGLAGMTALGRQLLETGQLRAGPGLGEVRDGLWNYLAIDHYERLVLIQGWVSRGGRGPDRVDVPSIRREAGECSIDPVPTGVLPPTAGGGRGRWGRCCRWDSGWRARLDSGRGRGLKRRR